MYSSNDLTNSLCDLLELDVSNFVILDDVKNIKNIKHQYNGSMHTFLFDVNKYIEEILISYNHDAKNILDQVYVDYSRTNIYCNNIRIPTIKDFIRKNNNFESCLFKTNKNTYNFLIILLMLCCQSSYGLHYMSLRDIYCENVDNLLLCSSNENRRTNFILENDILTISIETNLIIKDINSNIDIKKINTKVIIDVYLDTCKKTSTTKLPNDDMFIKFNEYGLFYWSVY